MHYLSLCPIFILIKIYNLSTHIASLNIELKNIIKIAIFDFLEITSHNTSAKS